MTYQVKFIGRLANSLGVRDTLEDIIVAFSYENMLSILHDKYEHVLLLEAKRIDRD